MFFKLSITLLLLCVVRADQRELREDESRCEHGDRLLEDGEIVARGFIPNGGCWEKRCERTVLRKRMYPCGPPAAALNTQFMGHIRGRRAIDSGCNYGGQFYPEGAALSNGMSCGGLLCMDGKMVAWDDCRLAQALANPFSSHIRGRR